MRAAQSTQDANRTRIILAAIVSGSALLGGCTMVGERLTGVALGRGAPTTCVKHCSDLYRALNDGEKKLHLARIEGCSNLSQTERGPCLDQEGARHAAEMERMSRDLVNCQNSCNAPAEGSAP